MSSGVILADYTHLRRAEIRSLVRAVNMSVRHDRQRRGIAPGVCREETERRHSDQAGKEA